MNKMKTLCVLAALLLTAGVSAQEADQDSVVVIGETGFLPVNPSRPFTGPSNLLICNTNASNNEKTTDIRYYSWRADTVIAMASSYILVGQPGEYTLKLTSRTATLKGSTNSNWTNDAQVTDNRNNTDPLRRRHVYKFVNTPERVGFQRDEAFADVDYITCNFNEGEHFYITITSPIGDKIAAANGKTGFADLDFITWHGPLPADATGIESVKADMSADNRIFDLQGRQLSQPVKGINILKGRKFVQK